MAEKKKKRGFLSKLGFKSKEEKLAEAAAEKAAQQKLVDEQMAARMAAINAAALKSAREQDEAEAGVTVDAEEQARIEAEEKRQAEIQAAKDVARAKQLAEEKARKEEEAQRLAEEEAARKAEAKARAEELAKQEAEAKAKAEEEAKARAAEEARIKAAEEKALADAKAKSEAEAAALKEKQEAEAKARAEEEARRQAEEAQRLADEKAAAEKAEAERLKTEALAAEKTKEKRLREEALEAERRAKVAAQEAEREAAEREAREKAEAEREAKRRQELIDQGLDPDAETDTLAEGGFLKRITKGLSKSTSRMSEQVSAVFTKRKLDDEALQDLEDILITSDFGVGPAAKVSALLAEDKFDKQVTDMEIKIALADVISDILTPLEKPIVLTSAKPQIMLFVGVNGSGKTTTLGKLAKRYHDQGKKVMIAAGDTFRAAAVEQLTVWSERAGAEIVSGKLGSDAAGLVYDAIEQAKAEDVDILMIDTAGRLQNRTELMDELAKVVRVIKKQDPSAPHHSILVLDATVGQNALMQTEAFAETAGVTGLIMTKLDGTAKGGVLVALSDKYKLPIHAIGIGERIEDLENFSAPVFAAALSGVADAMIEG
jgi:fused signal recognition particle receptor